ncbi:hypothetical protein DFH05DRAFT_1508372 [Lentinula detonsa]|uniref:Uncharacterized protein n=1 Tax=Lentinula detonsa TaxID=2804962 RepID=A0A9W8NSZ9_9AGAR|nr:hypothetical protein DFH05DRAFT_1508372 [Lentinula detonsa]
MHRSWSLLSIAFIFLISLSLKVADESSVTQSGITIERPQHLIPLEQRDHHQMEGTLKSNPLRRPQTEKRPMQYEPNYL